MSDATNQALEQAYEHVEAGRPEEAVPLLESLVAQDPDNLDAWWIYLHAVTDPQDARRALNNVLRLDPEYPGAAELMTTLDEKYPVPRIRRIEALTPPPALPEAAPVSAAPPIAAAAAPQRRGAPSVTLIAVVAVLAIVVVVLLVLTRGGADDTLNATQTAAAQAAAAITATETPAIVVIDTPTGSEATAQAEPTEIDITTEPAAEVTELAEITPESAAPTLAATETAVPEATAEIEMATSVPTQPELTPEATAEAGTGAGASVEDAYPGIAAVLARYTLPETGLEAAETSFGNTLVANVCSAPGAEARSRVEEVLTLMARESASLADDIDAIGARMVNCDDGSTIVALGVDRETAAGFATRAVSARDFSGAWRPLR